MASVIGGHNGAAHRYATARLCPHRVTDRTGERTGVVWCKGVRSRGLPSLWLAAIEQRLREEDVVVDLRGVKVTWLGHGTFKIRPPGMNPILLDAWVEHNPACPADQKAVGKLSAMLLTHGHFDHIMDAIPVAQASQPEQVIGIFELVSWLEKKGIANTIGMNIGGTVTIGDLRVTMVQAVHSCGIQDGDQIIYGGEAVGYVLRFGSGLTLYAAGDTTVFSDMQIIHDLYAPQIAILPIGDHFTMGPAEAAYAAGLLGVQAIIPAHYATFPLLTGTPQGLREALVARGLGQVEVVDHQPGQTLG